MNTGRRIRDEHGVVLPTRLMVLSISAVALAGLVFVATQGHGSSPDTAAQSSTSTHTRGSSPTATPNSGNSTPSTTTPSPTPPTTPAPPVRRGKTNVVVFNNSNVQGLAGRTASKAQRAGWNVVGSDNWYGTIDASTVYYGPSLKAAAQALAKDLGIARIRPSIAPMSPDRLTVILTGDYKAS